MLQPLSHNLHDCTALVSSDDDAFLEGARIFGSSSVESRLSNTDAWESRHESITITWEVLETETFHPTFQVEVCSPRLGSIHEETGKNR